MFICTNPTTSVTRPSGRWNLLQLLLCLAANPVEVSNPHIIITPKKEFQKESHYMIFHDILRLVAGSHSCSSYVASLHPKNNSWDVKAAISTQVDAPWQRKAWGPKAWNTLQSPQRLVTVRWRIARLREAVAILRSMRNHELCGRMCR